MQVNEAIDEEYIPVEHETHKVEAEIAAILPTSQIPPIWGNNIGVKNINISFESTYR